MPEIVIIGGGISGLGAAKKLVGKGHNVTVVNSTPYFEWPIAGSYSLTHPEELNKALSSTGWHVQGAKVVVGTAASLADGQVKLEDGRTLPYDALIIAVGFNCSYFKPSVGQPWAARKEEVKKIGDALRSASTVLIGGGGTIAVEFAGDVREVNPKARVVIVSRGSKALSYLDSKYSAKLARAFETQRIEVITEDSVLEEEAVLTKKDFKLQSGKTISADVYVPAYSKGSPGSWTGLANDKGEILVNEFLQAQGNSKVFAIGCSTVGFSAVMKIQSQVDAVAANVLATLKGQPLKAYKDNVPSCTHPVTQKIGHYTYAWVEYEQLPAPVGMCLKCCGFPFWGSCCLWTGGFCCSPCHPCACGLCCSDPEGSGTMAMLRIILHGTGATGIKLDKQEPPAYGAPAQQTMG